MAESRENFEIVRTIIRLVRNLKMKTIAEGIETAEQLVRLKKLNCEYGQGYFFSKPLEPEQARMFIG
jgi:EAL domain-containing protein (putative c-di-GMP-specific phosphodiesterase class I)